MRYVIFFYEDESPDVYVNGELAILRGKVQHFLARDLYSVARGYVHLIPHEIEVRCNARNGKIKVRGCKEYSCAVDEDKNGRMYARVTLDV